MKPKVGCNHRTLVIGQYICLSKWHRSNKLQAIDLWILRLLHRGSYISVTTE